MRRWLRRTLGPVAVGVGVWLSGADASAANGAPPRCAAPDPAADAFIGPADAPRTVQAWLDPTEPTSLLAWVELRRLVADERGRLRIDVNLARGDHRRQVQRDKIRRWAIGLAGMGKLGEALAAVDRDGHQRLIARLATPQTRAALAAELGVDAAAHDATLTDRCTQQKLDHNVDAVTAFSGGNSGTVRLPVFERGGAAFDDSPRLERLRPELGRDSLSPRLAPPAPATLPLQATHPGMRRPALGGILLGGPGLPHRFIVQARDEDDASLFMMLPLVLRARRQLPGRLSVHIVARGSSLGAAALRHRLCAAAILGREVEYVRVLAAPPPSRERPPHDVVQLLAALDGVKEKRCSDDPDPAQLDLPDGQWLDGLPRSRAELGNLGATIVLLQRSRRPLSLLWDTGTDD